MRTTYTEYHCARCRRSSGKFTNEKNHAEVATWGTVGAMTNDGGLLIGQPVRADRHPPDIVREDLCDKCVISLHNWWNNRKASE